MFKAMGYAFGAAMAASLGVMLVAMCVFGFRLAEWTEWQGGTAGIIGTIAGNCRCNHRAEDRLAHRGVNH